MPFGFPQSKGGKRQRLALPFALACLILPCFGSAAVAGPVDNGSYLLYENREYSPALGGPSENLLDIYTPRNHAAGPRPIAIWVHGGGWFQGSKVNVVKAKARAFVRRGFIFASVNYRRSPGVGTALSYAPQRVRHPAAVNDVARAVAWLDGRARRFGGDPRRVILLGHSAGAQIVSLLGTNPRFIRNAGMDPERIRGVIALDPVGLDLDRIASEPGGSREGTRSTYQTMVWNAFAAPWEADFEKIIRAASPLTHADRQDPPFFIVASARVKARADEARQMARKLGQLPGLANWDVNLGHRAINHDFGHARLDRNVTARAFRFARWVSSRHQARIVVRGRKAFRLPGGRNLARVHLRVRVRPGNALAICRIDSEAAVNCASGLRVAAGEGRHLLKARLIDPAGRPGPTAAFRFKVLPAASTWHR